MAAARELRKRGLAVRSLAGGLQQLERLVLHFDSKLPDVGTTIFTVMSRRALEEGALNIGQGFPDYPIDPRLAAAARSKWSARAAINTRRWKARWNCASRFRRSSSSAIGAAVDPQSEITVTCGGTEALYDAIQAVVRAGDEAIIFDPAYDAYEPAVRLAGGRCVRMPLAPPAVSLRLGPGAPCPERSHPADHHQQPAKSQLHCGEPRGSGRARGAASAIARSPCLRTRCMSTCSSMAGAMHPCLLHPELRERSFAVFSFGKTLHATGWRVGYCVAPRR